MKKYLMMAAATLVMGASFTSCSKDKDLYDPQGQALKFLQDYQAAFISVFGTPASNQTWGFGSAASSRMTRGADLTMPVTPTFRDNLTTAIVRPEMPTTYFDKLSDAIDAGAKYARDYQNYQNGDVIYVNTAYQTLNNPQNVSNLTIYVGGNVTYNGQTKQEATGGAVFCVTEGATLNLGAVSNNLIVYLAPTATLNLSQGTFSFQNAPAAIYLNEGSKVYVDQLNLVNGTKVLNEGGKIKANYLTIDQESTLWNEGSVEVVYDMTITNTGSSVYNAQNDTITVKRNFNLINNDCLLYNDGVVNITGDIEFRNTQAEIVNNNTLTGASLTFVAGGKMHNVGPTTITGLTKIENSQTQWRNENVFTTGDFEIVAYAEQVFNNCKLIVHKADNTGVFTMYGKFVLEGGDVNDDNSSGASVVTDNFLWTNNSYFYLGAKSMLKVHNEFRTNNYDINAALVGPTEGWAAIQAASITRPENLLHKQFGMTYLNNLYVDAGTHFDQGSEDGKPYATTSQPYYKYDSTVKFSHLGDVTNITIPETNCNPGFRKTIVEPTLPTLRVIAEDLTAEDAGDFDFNDVVFDAEYISANEVKVTIQAAGGTLPLTVYGQEVHAMFIALNPGAKTDQGGTINVKTMINTDALSSRPSEPYSSAELTNLPVITITQYNDWSDDDDTFAEQVRDRIPVVVTKTDANGNDISIELTAQKGKTPGKVGVPTTYKWKGERNYIGDGFKKFVKDPSRAMWWRE